MAIAWTEPGPASAELGTEASEAAELLGAFLRAVSHDLKSPLLTLSLSAELLADMLPVGERARVARDALTHGVREMERMLDAVTALARARARPLSERPVALGDLLSGQIVLCAEDGVAQAFVAADGRCVAELLAAVTGARPSEVHLELRGTHAHLALMLPAALGTLVESPVRALLGSLQQYAGTVVAPLAAAQVQLERQGGSVDCAGGRLFVRLPLAERTL